MAKKSTWRYQTNRKLVNFNTLEYIFESFPKAFMKLWGNDEPKPLMVGIADEIRKYFKAQKIDWKYDVSGALRIYCKSAAYQKMMLKPGNKRVNLEGKPVGKLTEKEVLYHRINMIKQQQFGYTEGYKQCINDMLKLMGRFATGKNFTRSCDSAKAHSEKLVDWLDEGGNIPSLFEEDSLATRLEVLHKTEAKEPKPVPKRPVLKLKVKSNRVLVKRKAA